MKHREIRIAGVLSKHQKGFGFVIPDNKEETEGRDVFISPDDMKSAMNKDHVSVKIKSISNHSRGLEGQIEKIVTRARAEIVGTLSVRQGLGIVTPESNKYGEEVSVRKRDFNGASIGDIVVVRILRWPSKDHKAEGRVSEVVSRKGEPGGEIKALIRAHQIKDQFPRVVLYEAESISESIAEADLVGRQDLRNDTVFTIDGADAKDLDDAVSLSVLDNGNYQLGVHIADVSHYVRRGSPLDMEALRRGTSIYLIDQVIPMLPKDLSNGICSLHPAVDRLTLSITMEINLEGEVISHNIFESVIRSKARLVYTSVSNLLENNVVEESEIDSHIQGHLQQMQELANILRKKRQDRGSLDFDFDEAYITLDKAGIPVSIETAERRVANRMIEEFMLVANETIAEHFHHMELPFVYRIHEKPSVDRILEFQRFLSGLGLTMKGSADHVHPKTLNTILNQVEGTEIEHVVNSVMLRSMKKAFYGTQCLGHFGLGVSYYCHFTSPIRRYPDLIIHRIIKESLQGTLNKDRIKLYRQSVEEAADQSSITERKAEELEREVEKLKKAEYMSYHLNEEFEGIISGVNNFGFFVEIPNTIEGLVRVDTLKDDYYLFEAERYRLLGQNSNKTFSLGDKVQIRVDTVDVRKREINFVIVGKS